MFLKISYAVNATVGVTLGLLLLLLKDKDDHSPALKHYKMVKRGLALLGLLGALFDIFTLYFLDTPSLTSPLSGDRGETGVSLLVLNHFALPLVLSCILLIIVTTLWRNLHIQESRMRILTFHYLLPPLLTTAYAAGCVLQMPQQHDKSLLAILAAYDATPYGNALCILMQTVVLYILIVLGGYTIYRILRLNRETKHTSSQAHQIDKHPIRRITLLAVLYAMLVVGDNIITTIQYDIFMLYAGIILYLLMVCETINGYYTFKLNEEVMVALSRQSATETMTREQKFRQSLDKWVADKRYTDNTATVEDIAKELGVSYAYMNNYFRSIIGVPFRTWRISHRLEEAKHLISTRPDLTLAQISEMVGYNDRSNFYRHFRDHEGCTPDDYKQKTLSSDVIS